MSLKLYRFSAGETDWIAANNETEARRVYLAEYELNDSDLEGVSVAVVDDADSVTVHLDEVDVETEEQATMTATEVMSKMRGPGLVCSTVYM
jgi:ketosteroid isomerase-like protein